MRLILNIFLFSTVLLPQPAWHTIKDKTGSCQLSVPPNWTILSIPGHAASPEHMETILISGLRPYRPFSEQTLKMLHVDTVLENSAKRSLYATKTSDGRNITYHVEVPGASNSCIAQISATSSYSQDEIKKIALTLSAAK